MTENPEIINMSSEWIILFILLFVAGLTIGYLYNEKEMDYNCLELEINKTLMGTTNTRLDHYLYKQQTIADARMLYQNANYSGHARIFIQDEIKRLTEKCKQ